MATDQAVALLITISFFDVFWESLKMWSAIVDHLVNHPRFAGPLAGATHEGIAGSPGEGPYLHLWLRVEDGRIVSAAYQTYGCFAAIASGEMLCLILKGKTLTEAATMTSTDLTTALQGLPEGKEHCPQLAITAMQRALNSLSDARLEAAISGE